jgi:tRNA (cmo5U34)-methyltransferase
MTARSEPEERPGHHWREPDRVHEYVARMDRRAAERQEQLTLLAHLIPYPAETPLQVLDLGAGYGVVAATVLRAFPNAQATLFDLSDEMMRIGAERMAEFAGRYRYVHGDFGDGTLPAELNGPYHAVVSARAIHHLPPEAKATLYRTIAGRLRPDGCFLNLDLVAAPDEIAGDLYRRVAELERAAHGESPPERAGHAVHAHHSELQPVAAHLDWLRQGGFGAVDCFWKLLDTALIGGYRPDGTT